MWHILSESKVIIGSNNGPLPCQRQAMVYTNDDVLPIRLRLIKTRNVIENVGGKILTWDKWVNANLSPRDNNYFYVKYITFRGQYDNFNNFSVRAGWMETS